MGNLTTLVAIAAMSLLITGCPDSGSFGTGSNDNDNDSMVNDNAADDNMNDDDVNDNDNDEANDNDNDEANDNDDGEMNDNDDGTTGGGSTNLSTISFDGGDVAFGEGPVTFAIGGGTINFAGGDVGTRGIQALYGDGFSSWNVDPEDSPSTITFNDLTVTGVLFYFAQVGSIGGTITARDADGAMIGEPISSVETNSLGDPAGFINLQAPAGVTIATLTIEFGGGVGDVVAVDTMTLTVATN